ncbi:hypothetical protein Hdeb2414_s0006g00213981 [Helianthus debilis subsp. tardiflorus]
MRRLWSILTIVTWNAVRSGTRYENGTWLYRNLTFGTLECRYTTNGNAFRINLKRVFTVWNAIMVHNRERSKLAIRYAYRRRLGQLCTPIRYGRSGTRYEVLLAFPVTMILTTPERKVQQVRVLTGSLTSILWLVTIIVAARGVPLLPPIKSSAQLKEALRKLASVPSREIMGVVVLWTPQKEDDSLTAKEMLEDYP